MLEYAHWPGAEKVDRLVVVGDVAQSATSCAYLAELRDRFAVPVEYMHLPG